MALYVGPISLIRDLPELNKDAIVEVKGKDCSASNLV